MCESIACVEDNTHSRHRGSRHRPSPTYRNCPNFFPSGWFPSWRCGWGERCSRRESNYSRWSRKRPNAAHKRHTWHFSRPGRVRPNPLWCRERRRRHPHLGRRRWASTIPQMLARHQLKNNPHLPAHIQRLFRQFGNLSHGAE